MIESFARRTAGLLLIAFSAVLALIVAAQLAENALTAGSSVQPLGVRDMAIGGIASWGITIAGLWWHRRRPPMWRIWARWAAFPGVFIALLEAFQVDRGRQVALIVAVGLGVVCWALGEAVVLVTTRPVTAGLLASRLEIPFPTKGLKARVCVREDRLALDSLTSRRKRSRDVVAVPWTALHSIDLINVEHRTDYRPYKMAVVGAFLLMPLFMLSGTALSLTTGSAKWQKQFQVIDGMINSVWIATLGIASVVFLFLLSRFVIKPFFGFMEGQNFIEAFPELPQQRRT